MKRTIVVMLTLCLMVGPVFLVGCDTTKITGDNNCFPTIKGDGDINGGCEESFPADGEGVNLCSYPSGTDIPDDTCRQNGGSHDCVPCSEVE